MTLSQTMVQHVIQLQFVSQGGVARQSFNEINALLVADIELMESTTTELTVKHPPNSVELVRIWFAFSLFSQFISVYSSFLSVHHK